MDVCGFMNGTSNNPASKWLFDICSKSFPKELLHACPYVGELKFFNINVDTKVLANMFPNGCLKAKMTFYTNDDDQMFILKTLMDTYKMSNNREF